jgi:SAM-dependent methyltransferase/uncharacterized protein YbaR (Trm112 family)
MKLEEILVCPKCKKKMIYTDGNYFCSNCDKNYPIKGNMPIFLELEKDENDKKVNIGNHAGENMAIICSVSEHSFIKLLPILKNFNSDITLITKNENYLQLSKRNGINVKDSEIIRNLSDILNILTRKFDKCVILSADKSNKGLKGIGLFLRCKSRFLLGVDGILRPIAIITVFRRFNVIMTLLRKLNSVKYNRFLFKSLQSAEFGKKELLKKIHCKMGYYMDFSKTNKILELGCGPGKYCALLSNQRQQVVGQDIVVSPFWSNISQKFPDNSFVLCKGENLPYEDNCFDYCLLMGVLLYVDDDISALKEIHRVLKNKGMLFLRTQNKNNLRTVITGKTISSSVRNLYYVEDLKNMLIDAGFDIKETYLHYFSPPFFPEFCWIIHHTFLPEFLREFLSWLTPKKYRITINIIAEKISEE